MTKENANEIRDNAGIWGGFLNPHLCITLEKQRPGEVYPEIYLICINTRDHQFIFLHRKHHINQMLNLIVMQGCQFSDFSLISDFLRIKTHSRRDLFRVFDIGFGQIEGILGIILAKEFFKKSN